MKSRWTNDSVAAIREALREGRARGLERANWPYQVWLRERRKLCRSLLPPGKAGPKHELDRLDELEADMRRVAGSMRRS